MFQAQDSRVRVNSPLARERGSRRSLLLSVLLCVFLPLFVSCRGHPHKERENQPAFSCDCYSYQVGTVLEGSRPVARFVIRNTGQGVLSVRKITTGCGCTAAQMSRRDLAPGEDAALLVEFNTAGLNGVQSRKVFLETNDSNKQIVELAVVGEVREALVCRPRVLEVGQIHRGEEWEGVVSISAPDGSGTGVRGVEAPNEWVSVALEQESQRCRAIARVRLDTRSMPLGRFEHRILVSAAEGENVGTTVRVCGELVSDWVVQPPHVMLGTIGGHDSCKRTLRLSNWRQTPFAIKGITASDPRLRVVYRRNQYGASHDVEVSFIPAGAGNSSNENLKESLTVDVGDNENAPIVIPVYALLRGEK